MLKRVASIARKAIAMPSSARRLFADLRHVFGNRQGVAAVEFAMIFPIALLLYVGAAELAQANMTSRRVMVISSTLVQLASQQSTSSQSTSTPAPSTAIAPSVIAAMFDAATALIAPAPATPLKLTLSAVDLVNNAVGLCCDAKVRWSYTQSGVLRPCNVLLTKADPAAQPSPTTISSAFIPNALTLLAPESALIADVSYTYQPVFASTFINFTSGMSRTTYMNPRSTGQVILTTPVTTSGSRSGQVCY